jgi:uncharacterized membrane protein AbrB (regulator of aidB expression)
MTSIETARAPGLALAAQVRTQLWWWDVRTRAGEKLREERGDVYSNTIMIAIAVVIAITVGGILLAKFTDKANSINTDTPAGAVNP